MSLANIKTRHTGREIALLLGALCILLIGVEFATRRLIIPASRLERQINDERTLLKAPADPRHSVLIVGNSLTQDGVKLDVMNKRLGGNPRIYRYAIAQTVFFDWRFGLEGILRRPESPATTLVLMSPDHFASRGGRGDYSALRLIESPEILAYSMALDLHPTEVSRVLFSHVSAYYGFPNELRKNLHGKIFPDVPSLMQKFNVRSSSQATLDTASLRVHLADLHALGVRYGRQILVGSPPLLEQDSNMRTLCMIAQEEGLQCILPADMAVYPSVDFSDGFHLGPVGAEKFSSELADRLKLLSGN